MCVRCPPFSIEDNEIENFIIHLIRYEWNEHVYVTDKLTHLDYHHLYRDMLREPDWGHKVHGQSYQQVHYGHQVFRVDC